MLASRHAANLERRLHVRGCPRTRTASEIDIPGGSRRRSKSRDDDDEVQPLPGRKRLLQNGQHVIDRAARRIVFSLLPPSLKFDSKLVRQVLSNSFVAAWEGTTAGAKLAPMELNEADIARAREVACDFFAPGLVPGGYTSRGRR